MASVYPLLFEPIFKQRIWGGRNLERLLGKTLPAATKIGESWELADLPGEESVVAAGADKGRSLRELVERWGKDLLGAADLYQGRFPLLIKFLDAEDILSVQVHPDTAAAAELGPDVRAKYEAWYVIEARPGAVIYCGLKPGVTREKLVAASRDGTVGELLNAYPARAGDCFYLPAGTVHALGAGLVIAEPQTPSDVTYRLFDWNRTDPKTGKGRELHLEQGIHVTRPQYTTRDFLQEPQALQGFGRARGTRLAACEAFVIDRFDLDGSATMSLSPGEMAVWMVLRGSGSLSGPGYDVPVRGGNTVLLPAALPAGAFAAGQDTTWLKVTVPRR
jgi:mannose-6-phosphate isomerase